jgi:hypothetical protein
MGYLYALVNSPIHISYSFMLEFTKCWFIVCSQTIRGGELFHTIMFHGWRYTGIHLHLIHISLYLIHYLYTVAEWILQCLKQAAICSRDKRAKLTLIKDDTASLILWCIITKQAVDVKLANSLCFAERVTHAMAHWIKIDICPSRTDTIFIHVIFAIKVDYAFEIEVPNVCLHSINNSNS